MVANLREMDILTRREIEARIAGPLIRAFIDKLGRKEALSVVRPVIESLAQESGRGAAQTAGGDSIAHLAKAMEAWSAGDAYETKNLEQTETRFDWDVTRCAYAEMYEELGMADLGYELSCGRDFAMIKGFNPQMKLTRTKTVMQGDECCDFRVRII